jgi:DNA-binding NarL/FixJ family response regulator
MNTIRLAVIDDHPLFREGVTRSLSEMEGFLVVGEGETKDDAVRICEEAHPDVMLLDISMPGGGIEAIRPILERAPEQRIVLLTVSEQADDVTTALSRGAKGYVLKGVGSRALAEIIRTVASGHSYVTPTLSARLLSELNAAEAPKGSLFGDLTAREREVLDLVAEGLSNKHIAIKLDLQEKTVKHHMTQILSKLQVSNRTEAALVLRDQMDGRYNR